ncbi:MAG: ABC transporter ATP-binding protein [Erysipelotrichaceae bacterium]|nr:ABC transporter ATP-binding protein [Erysipelotrichaceae bacterium]MCR5095782.1 ABC transporter ATP-binding protein [Erysipelotrichaceae bacterium]
MSNKNKEVLLSVKGVDISFDVGKKKPFRAVKNANFDIYRGETFALVGESGSGKTTIGRAILRINELSKGEIIFKGKKISGKISKEDDREVIRSIQMIFQDPAASLNERANIEYCVSEGINNFHLYTDEADRIAKVDKALMDVGLLPEHKSRYPHEFSGGQRQRVGIARAMIMEPELIVADEPISALDVSIRAQVLNLMNKLKDEKGLTYLFIAHDLSVVRFISDRIAVIHLGRIVEIAETEELFKHPLHPYTISLLSAVPMPDPQIEKPKKHVVYDESKRDHSGPKPILQEIRPGHLVFGNDREMAEYEAKLQEMEKAEAEALKG